jgi:hypothetical protein
MNDERGGLSEVALLIRKVWLVLRVRSATVIPSSGVDILVAGQEFAQARRGRMAPKRINQLRLGHRAM